MASGPAHIPPEAVAAAAAGGGSGISFCSSSFGVRPRCVLVVEKDAVFARLVAAGLPASVPSVLVTGRGYPDHATRAFAAALCRALAVPAFGLCDCDPDGLRVLLAYARTPRTMGYTAAAATAAGRHHALPQLAWLGLRPSHQQQTPQKALLPLTPRDRAAMLAVLLDTEAPLSPQAAAEARAMGAAAGNGRGCGGKAELESLGDSLPCAVESMLLGRDWVPLLK